MAKTEVVHMEAPKRQSVVVENPIPIFDTAQFEQMGRIAAAMGKASLMPKHLRGNNIEEAISNAFIIVNMAYQLKVDPFRLAQASYELHGKIGFEGKLIHAVVEREVGHGFEFEYSGEGDHREITVTNTRRVDGSPRSIKGTVGMWKTFEGMKNKDKDDDNRSSTKQVKGNWRSDPDKQLRYRGVVEWCRAWEPGIIVGILTEDELSNLRDDYDDRRAARVGTVEIPAAQRQITQEPTTIEGKAEPAVDWESIITETRIRLAAMNSTPEMGQFYEEIMNLDQMPSEVERRLSEMFDKAEESLNARLEVNAAAAAKANAEDALKQQEKAREETFAEREAREKGKPSTPADIEKADQNVRSALDALRTGSAMPNETEKDGGAPFDEGDAEKGEEVDWKDVLMDYEEIMKRASREADVLALFDNTFRGAPDSYIRQFEVLRDLRLQQLKAADGKPESLYAIKKMATAAETNNDLVAVWRTHIKEREPGKGHKYELSAADFDDATKHFNARKAVLDRKKA